MKKTHFILGGDLQKSLSEGVTLHYKQLFKDAFSITRARYLPLIIACMVTISILTMIFLLSFEKLSTLNEISQVIINFVFSSFIIPPLITGLQMMGIHHAIGLKTRSSDIFNYFNIVLKLALASLIINIIFYIITLVFNQLLGGLGVQIAIIIILYLNMAFRMVYPLIAEKKIAPQLAVKLSFKLVNKNLRQFTFLFMMLALLGILAVIPFGLGLFLFVPFYFNVMGIVYRQMCGVGVVATEVEKGDDDDDHHAGKTSNDNTSEFEA